MSKMIFVNLPVQDVARSIAFYEAIGCVHDTTICKAPNAAMMKWSDEISFMLLDHAFYATFTDKKIADAHSSSEVSLCLSRDTRADVDTIVDAAAKAGGTLEARPANDTGFMYGRGFDDPDGHHFEAVWMDVEAALKAMQPETTAA